MKHVFLCADDYALAPGVSAAIRALVHAERLNATSVMTIFPGLKDEARTLSAACAGRKVSVGLHVTLTGGFTPLSHRQPMPELRALVRDALLRRLDLDAVAQEVEAQFAAFHGAFGRPPDHVDGHQHAHVLPGVRRVVLAATARHAPKAWIRNVTPAAPALGGLDPKARLIGAFGRGLARDAARMGLSTSARFAGAYDFDAGQDFASLLARFLKGAPEGGVVMVHPGLVDGPLLARDPLTHQREAELEVLAGAAMPDLLAQAGARLF